MELKLIDTGNRRKEAEQQAKLTAKQIADDLYKIIANTDYDMASVIRYLDKLKELGK